MKVRAYITDSLKGLGFRHVGSMTYRLGSYLIEAKLALEQDVIDLVLLKDMYQEIEHKGVYTWCMEKKNIRTVEQAADAIYDMCKYDGLNTLIRGAKISRINNTASNDNG